MSRRERKAPRLLDLAADAAGDPPPSAAEPAGDATDANGTGEPGHRHAELSDELLLVAHDLAMTALRRPVSDVVARALTDDLRVMVWSLSLLWAVSALLLAPAFGAPLLAVLLLAAVPAVRRATQREGGMRSAAEQFLRRTSPEQQRRRRAALREASLNRLVSHVRLPDGAQAELQERLAEVRSTLGRSKEARRELDASARRLRVMAPKLTSAQAHAVLAVGEVEDLDVVVAAVEDAVRADKPSVLRAASSTWSLFRGDAESAEHVLGNVKGWAVLSEVRYPEDAVLSGLLWGQVASGMRVVADDLPSALLTAMSQGYQHHLRRRQELLAECDVLLLCVAQGMRQLPAQARQ